MDWIKTLTKIALLLVILGTSRTACAGFQAFAGTYSGSALVAQGEIKKGARILGTALITVKGTAKSAKITITGSFDQNKTTYTQTITLAKGKATYSSIIPGISGFETSSEGTYRLAGKRIFLKSPSVPSNYKIDGRVEFINAGSTITIQNKITLSSGEPVYFTVVGT